jgi:hypothetical protein
MDLSEAEKSLEHFAELLKVECALLSLIVVEDASTEAASRARELRKQALINLRESRKNSLVISILVSKAIAERAEQLIWVPEKLAKVLTASNRLAQASHEAHRLIEEQEKNMIQKSEPKQPSATSIAIAAFLERKGYRARASSYLGSTMSSNHEDQC